MDVVMDKKKPTVSKSYLLLLVLITSLWLFTAWNIYTKPDPANIDDKISNINQTLASNNITVAFLENRLTTLEKKLEAINAFIIAVNSNEDVKNIAGNNTQPTESSETLTSSDNTGKINNPQSEIPNKADNSISLSTNPSQSHDSIENIANTTGENITYLSSDVILSAIRLHESILKNADFDSELRILKSLSANHPAIQKEIAIIEQNTPIGKSTMEELIVEFDVITTEIVRHEKEQKLNPTITDQLTIYLSKLVDIKKVKADSLSNTSEDILARTYGNLIKSNLKNAIIEAKKLEGNAKAIATDWIVKAEARNSLNDASGNIFKYITNFTN
jgi:hypothetical protein